MLKKISCSIIFILLVFAVYFYSQTPSLDREWSKDQVVPAEVVIDGEEVTIKNVRNFTYRSTTDYTPNYYDTTVLLSNLKTVDYIVEPFGDIGAAHTFLSFGFTTGEQIAISVEIRKEVGESFSPLKGILNQYELMYVIADERDVINLRANHRQHDVFLYPTEATPEQARILFVSMLTRANSLQTKPEFYHTLLSNCTTNIAKHINEITPGRIGLDYRLILPEHSDILAQELGLIATSTSIEEARKLHKINTQAEKYQGDEDFSKLIREFKIVPESGESYPVEKVIDGDTIDVRVNGEVKRVRYIGIDTPEKYPEEKAECLADEAKQLNESLVAGQKVKLVKDTRDTDDYGRLLRYVYVGDIFINKELVTEGLARAVVYEPDNNQAEVLDLAEMEAKNRQKGIWGEACLR